MEILKMRIYLLLFPFLFAQDNTQQVEINISTTMDIAYAGKIFLNTTQYASKGLYKEEVEYYERQRKKNMQTFMILLSFQMVILMIRLILLKKLWRGN